MFLGFLSDGLVTFLISGSKYLTPKVKGERFIWLTFCRSLRHGDLVKLSLKRTVHGTQKIARQQKRLFWSLTS